MSVKDDYLNVTPLVHNSDIDYEIEVLSKEKIYSNLDKVYEDGFQAQVMRINAYWWAC